ncbi:MAG: hypothetical protein D6736_18790 [Nitrospinota bacterium]|nr:MAG: hypothetical protein D6736_18790 [Nitrospinota bacterium]
MVVPPEEEKKRSLKERLFPESRMRVFKMTMPESLFELATRIPILERFVIRRYYRQRFWENWLVTGQDSLKGMTPVEAMRDPEGRELLERLFTRWRVNGEKGRWELLRIRWRLKCQSRRVD